MAKKRAKKSAKGGRPTKLGTSEKDQIIAILSEGGSRNIAARIVGVATSTIANEAKRDRKFLDALRRAEAQNEFDHLKRVKDGKQNWQSSAWFLERKWPARYGRRESMPVKEAATESVTIKLRPLSGGAVRAAKAMPAPAAVSTNLPNASAGAA